MTLVDDIKTLLESPRMNVKDVRTLLRGDHDELLQVARDMFESEGAEERRTLLKKLKPALVAHSRAEEKEVYEPLTKLAGETRDIAYEGYVEHGLLDELLERLSKSRKTETDEWKAHAKVLFELLQHHIEEEHAQMFDELVERFSDEQREVMGRRFVAAKARLAIPKARAA
jgi:hypothetical protein